MTTYTIIVALAALIGGLVGILLTALVMIYLTRRDKNDTWFSRWRGLTVSSEEERKRVEDQRNRERWYEYQRRREDALRRAV